MDVATLARTIQLIVAPAVLVTSCAILVGGLLQRYAAINDRLRAMNQERFERVSARRLPAAPGADPLLEARFAEMDWQVPHLLRRHSLLHDALLSVYVALALFVLSMFVIAASALAGSAWLATAALVVFLGGTALLLRGIVLTVVEVRSSQRDIRYEVEHAARTYTL